MSCFFVILGRVMELTVKSFIFTPTFNGSFHMFPGQGWKNGLNKGYMQGYIINKVIVCLNLNNV